MKNAIFLFTLISSLSIAMTLNGQTAIELSGTVKSPQGAVQGAQIDFLDAKDNFISNSISGPTGRFRSETKVTVGKTVKVRITKSGYEDFEKVVKVEKNGDAGEFLLKAQRLAISGFVKDSITERPIPGVEVSFYQNSRRIEAKSTDDRGYFDLETNFVYGQKITVRVSKKDYYDKEQTLTFTSDGMNRLEDILLPAMADRGLRVFMMVIDKKSRKPLSGALVRYSDKKTSDFIDAPVPASGPLQLKIYDQPGKPLNFQIIKPGYRTISASLTLSADPPNFNNLPTYELERDRKSAAGPVLLVGSIATGLLGGGMYYSSTKKYESYKDYGNANRESDFNSAQSMRTISAAAAGVAAGALIGFIIYKINEKNKIKAIERKQIRVSFSDFQSRDQYFLTASHATVSINYHF